MWKKQKREIRKYDLRILVIGFTDYKKAYDMVSWFWLKKTLKMVGVADNIRRLLGQSIVFAYLQVFTSNDDIWSLHGTPNIPRMLSPFLFIIILITMTLNNTNYGYLLSKETLSIIFYSRMTYFMV